MKDTKRFAVKISYKVILLAMVCGMLVSLVSCSAKKSGGNDGPKKDIQPLASIVVLPAETLSGKSGDAGEGQGDSLRKGADLVDITLQEQATDIGNIRVLTGRQIEELLKEDSEYAANDLIRHLGSVLHCDAVLMITVNRYRERVGGELAAESPASASFQMRLIDAKNTTVLWSSDFDETQESLMDNLLTFNKAQSRGFKWVTVEKLVTQGIRDRLANCPYLKK